MSKLCPLVLLGLICGCGSNPDGFEPWPDGAEYYVGWPTCPDTALAFSPGGDVLLFCSSAAGNPGIYGYNGAGDPSLRTFASYDEFTGPTGCWSDTTADGIGKIVFAALREDGSGELRWIPGSLYDVHLMLYDSLPHMQPTWCPSGDSIVFCTQMDGRWGLWRSPADSVVPAELYVPAGDCTRPSYSPDGQWILFQFRESEANDWNIWMVRPDGSDAHVVVNGSSQDIHPTWAPAAYPGWFAFSSDRTGNFEIWISDLEGDSLVQVTDDPGSDVYPAWNQGPDRWIAFSADRVGNDGAYDIFWIADPLSSR
jgi:Tol biopolymer transport system component